jgi:mono/diheme cytochrome c family protein
MIAMQRRATVGVLTICLVAIACMSGGAQSTRSVSEGVYTAGQASRGSGIYAQECSTCHGAAPTGSESGPPLVGDEFLKAWSDLTLADLFERIQSSMPKDSPGRLSQRQYIDIVAYVLSANGFMAGSTELGPDLAALSSFDYSPRHHPNAACDIERPGI